MDTYAEFIAEVEKDIAVLKKYALDYNHPFHVGDLRKLQLDALMQMLPRTINRNAG